MLIFVFMRGFPMLKKKLGAWYINYAITDKDLGDLLGWAAHEDMYKLLNERHTKEEATLK